MENLYVFVTDYGFYMIPSKNGEYLELVGTRLEYVPKMTLAEVIIMRAKHEDQLRRDKGKLHQVYLTSKEVEIKIESVG